MADKKEHYNNIYATQSLHPHSQRDWFYHRYISCLLSSSGLKRGSSVLDIGCGTGYFSYLIRMCGMEVHGVDISEAGVQAAKIAYGNLGIMFEVVDILSNSLLQTFDCIFVRSCSIYNSDQFPLRDEPTRSLTRYLKRNGIFIFVYNTKFSESSGGWRYHSLEDVRKHFSNFNGARVYFSSRFDAFVLGKRAFNPVFTRINIFLSRGMGFGGDLICIFHLKENHSVL